MKKLFALYVILGFILSIIALPDLRLKSLPFIALFIILLCIGIVIHRHTVARLFHFKFKFWFWPQGLVVGWVFGLLIWGVIWPFCQSLYGAICGGCWHFYEYAYNSRSLAPLIYTLIPLIVAYFITKKVLSEEKKTVTKEADPEIAPLNSDRYVEILYNNICNEKPPTDASSGNAGVASFLYGANGRGKTYVLNLLEEKIRKEKQNIRVVRFNPWEYTSESELITAFFSAITDTLSKDYLIGDLVTIPTEFTSLIKGSHSWLGPLALALQIFHRSQTFEAMSKTMKDRASELEIRIVMFIDDLDRCSPEIKKLLFQLLNHADRLKNFLHIIVAASAQELLALNAPGTTQNERALERYVKHAVHMGTLTFKEKRNFIQKDLESWKLDQPPRWQSDIDSWKENENNTLEKIFSILETPRQLQAFCTRMSLKIKNDLPINGIHLVIATAIEVAKPHLHEWIIEHKEQILGGKISIKKIKDNDKDSDKDSDTLFKKEPAFQALFEILFLNGMSWNDEAANTAATVYPETNLFAMNRRPVFEGFYSFRTLPEPLTFTGWEQFLSADTDIEKETVLFFDKNFSDPEIWAWFLQFIHDTLITKKGTPEQRIGLYFGVLRAYGKHPQEKTLYPISQGDFMSGLGLTRFTYQVCESITDIENPNITAIHDEFLRIMQTHDLDPNIYQSIIQIIANPKHINSASDASRIAFRKKIQTENPEKIQEIKTAFSNKITEQFSDNLTATNHILLPQYNDWINTWLLFDKENARRHLKNTFQKLPDTLNLYIQNISMGSYSDDEKADMLGITGDEELKPIIKEYNLEKDIETLVSSILQNKN